MITPVIAACCNITVDDLDDESFKIFRREALRSRRMTREELDIPNAELLSKLGLMKDGKLKRSAVLLFYHDPGIVQVGSYIKIGRFGKGADLLYHDDLEGSLIKNADQVIDIIYLKYLKAKVDYVHDRRVETYPFAREAIREAVYNAIAHTCYMYGVPIQIRIEDEQLIISNQCIFPEGWTVDTLMEPHDSVPYNPDIANVFYRAGYIEHWGRGIEKICDECRKLGTEPPRCELLGHGLRVFFKALESALIDQPKVPNRQNVGKNVGLDVSLADKILDMISSDPEIKMSDMADKLGVTTRTIEREMKRLREAGIVSRIGEKRYGYWQINRQIRQINRQIR